MFGVSQTLARKNRHIEIAAQIAAGRDIAAIDAFNTAGMILDMAGEKYNAKINEEMKVAHEKEKERQKKIAEARKAMEIANKVGPEAMFQTNYPMGINQPETDTTPEEVKD